MIILLLSMLATQINSASVPAEPQNVEVGVEENLSATNSLDQIVYDVDGTPN